MKNPLVAAYRKPAIFINLPSGGKYYTHPPKLSVDNELAIYAMTAKDELVTKTPDALFNGEATISLIESCCPDIADPREIPVNDLLAILIGIRHASYGEDVDVDVSCPECNFLNQLSIQASNLLANAPTEEKVDFIKLDDTGFKVKVKPYNLNDRTQLQVQSIKQKKLIEGLGDANLSDSEREAKFGQTFVEIANLTVSLMANSIISVQMPDGESSSDTEVILEWLQSITKKDYDLIKDIIDDLSKSPIDTKFNATCQECNHQWETAVDLDIANFFEG